MAVSHSFCPPVTHCLKPPTVTRTLFRLGPGFLATKCPHSMAVPRLSPPSRDHGVSCGHTRWWATGDLREQLCLAQPGPEGTQPWASFILMVLEWRWLCLEGGVCLAPRALCLGGHPRQACREGSELGACPCSWKACFRSVLHVFKGAGSGSITLRRNLVYAREPGHNLDEFSQHLEVANIS